MNLKLPAPVIGVLRGYAVIFFLDSPWAGAVFLSATFWFANAGFTGLLAAIVAMLIARIIGFANWSSGLHIYNSILVGLSLGLLYKLDGYLIGVVCLSSALTVFLSVAISDSLWRLERLPALSLPFALAAVITALSSKSYGALSYYPYPYNMQPLLNWPLGDGFLRALGTIFFMPHPIPGMLVFTVLLCASRYMSLLAISGYIAGHFFQEFMLGSSYPDIIRLNEFNFILTAIALGGIFTLPSWQGFVLALFSSALVALVSKAMQNLMPMLGLSIMPGAFLLVTLTMLAALNKRIAWRAPILLLNAPALPEVSLERARLAKVRAVTTDSITLLPPFLGEWSVYQGFAGAYTHQAPWQYALDFIISHDGRSYQNAGQCLDDFYCYGLPVVSPVYGWITSGCAEFGDNPPGEVDIHNNWGNYLLIDCGHDIYVVLAHLQQNSLLVAPGDQVVPGQRLARCGNSGRSPQPHIHLHVQRGRHLGNATLPFQLGFVIVRQQQRQRFYLAATPSATETVVAAVTDNHLAAALHLPVGRCLTYRFRINQQAWVLRSLMVVLTLEGQFRLLSDSGASAAFIETANVLAFYDRTGPEDGFLDMWLLHLGLTPLAAGKIEWQDSPSIRLFPLTLWEKIFYHGTMPFFASINSHYCRDWDSTASCWIQQGRHNPLFYPGKQRQLTSRALIYPERGCLSLRLETDKQVLEADMQAAGLRHDVGIPGVDY